MDERDLEARCAAQERLIYQQRVKIANLERDVARLRLHAERLERRLPKQKSPKQTAKQKAEQVFNGKDKTVGQAIA